MISSAVLSRNRLASGLLAMPMAAFHFACKSHIDVKRTLSRFGMIVGDSTTRKNMKSMTESSLAFLKFDVATALNENQAACSVVLDNVQQYCLVHEDGIGKQNQLKVGTAATAVYLEDCEPGAFSAQDHINRVVKKERAQMTIESLLDDIDWSHVYDVTVLHWVRVLAEFVPQLHHLQKEISKRFRSEPIARHRMRPGRKTKVQPLGTNAERETENQGMLRAILDFEKQTGQDVDPSKDVLRWIRGDGASFAAITRLKKYLCMDLDDSDSFRNRFSTPEVWHTRATNLNTISDNHFGPAASQDPSALSKSASCAQMKRPSDTKDVNFYPTVRSLTLFWEMQVIDCWREYLKVDDVLVHFKKIAYSNPLLSLEGLIEVGRVLVKRYASQDAYEQALTYKNSIDTTSTDMKVPVGSQWKTPPTTSVETNATVAPASSTDPPAETVPNDVPAETGKSKGRAKTSEDKVHAEVNGFDGDRVLANSILFLQEFGWWIEAAYAVPEGDVGRLNEILKIWIFTFAGSTNQNYKDYLLELYCLLKYEVSKDLKNAILNNMLVNLTGELGKWIEADLMQEHYNRWLEDMVSKRGGEFDDEFYRHTISPNVNHFLRIKEIIEGAFNMNSRSKTHTSPHLRDESCLLLSMYKETELHRFCSRRSMGHAAKNHFNLGHSRLQEGKLTEFVKRTTAYADIVKEVQQLKKRTQVSDTDVVESAPGSPILPNSPQQAFDEDPTSDDEGSDGSGTSSLTSDDNEHEDCSERPLKSGSYRTMFVDLETGQLVNNYTADEEDEDNIFDEDEATQDIGEEPDSEDEFFGGISDH